MANRITYTNVENVRALNVIDVEFASDSDGDRDVREAWTTMLTHLNTPRPPDNAGLPWDERLKDLQAEILAKMGRTLGYDFDFTHYKNQAYYPQGHHEEMVQNCAIRKLFLEIVQGERAFKMEVTKLPDIHNL